MGRAGRARSKRSSAGAISVVAQALALLADADHVSNDREAVLVGGSSFHGTGVRYPLHLVLLNQKQIASGTRRVRRKFGALPPQFHAAHMADLADTFVDFNRTEQTMATFDAELGWG
jgi:hypothetical protein